MGIAKARRAIVIVGAAVGIAACSGVVSQDRPLPDDAGASDAFAGDSRPPADDAATGPDVAPAEASSSDADDSSAGDAPPNLDAPASTDAVSDGSRDAAPEGAAEGSPSCNDACALADVECAGPGGGNPVSGVSTCVLGGSGCTVWETPSACSASFGCCVACKNVPCADGSPSECQDCPVGPTGASCMQDSDCGLDACDAVTHSCVADQCADHRQDGDESDVDCGGAICDGCSNGKRCNTSLDCAVGNCIDDHHCM
jgi:hypothetical protein